MEQNQIKKRPTIGTLVLIVLLVAVFVITSSAAVITHENEYRVIQQFGKVVAVNQTAGLSFKTPLISTVSVIPKQILFYDIPLSDVITSDKKTMVLDSFILWRVTDPTSFIQTLSGQTASAETRLGNLVFNATKTVISSMTQAEIISGRGLLADRITEAIGTNLDQYGVEIVAIETKHLDLPDDNKSAVYERMISERNNIAASYGAEGESEARKIRTDTDKTIAIQLSEAEAQAEAIVAEGEAEYMRILSQAYGDSERADFYTFVRALDAAKVTMKGENKTLFLPADSPLAQIFSMRN
jgi:membrane protease subunit HflC